MRRSIALLALTFVIAGACYSSDDDTASGPMATATALIDTGGDSVLVNLEIADTDAERRRGLMFRESLPQDRGMAFVYFEEHSGGFWMRNTLIPLSIAFFDRGGEILRILDMEPCETDSCEIYDPGVSYVGALEVNQGMFDEWGVEEGDRITISQ
ncbi:MAG: DUF192 domain-containing protein [Actinomycetota bacterium]